jgi:tRNA dimethylallyltransferase
MASRPDSTPLIVIVGPTASGKTALAIKLAKKFNGEIITADSRTIYKGMDVGTAKPTVLEQKSVPHWGLDLVESGAYFSVADFKIYADQKIAEIRNRGHIPFLVGGTGLYIDAVVFDYQFGAVVNNELREKLNTMSLDELYEYCQKNDIDLPENVKNKRYVIRAIENVNTLPQRNKDLINNTIIVGIATDKVLLQQRIAKRTEQLFEDGVVDEATKLGDMYGWENEAMKSNIYPLIHEYLNGTLSLDEVKVRFKTADWQLAKRQVTWLKRNEFIHWFSLPDAEGYLSKRLATER